MIAALALYLAVAAVVAGLGRRRALWPSFQGWLVLVCLPLVVVLPSVAGGRVLAPIDLLYASEPFRSELAARGLSVESAGVFSDVSSQLVPWRSAVRAAFAAGEWPLWNPSILGGDILAAAAQPAPYAPLTLLGLLLPLGPSLLATALLALFFACLGTYLLARGLGCGEGPALFSAAAFGASNYLIFWLGWPLGQSTVWLPWVLVATRRAIARPGLGSFFGLTGTFALLLLAGHPETAAHVVLAALAAAGLWWWELRPQRPALAVSTGLAAGVAALLLTAVFLLPFLEALPQSAEQAFRQAHYAHADRSAPWPEALLRLVPSFLPTFDDARGTARFQLGADWSYPSTAYLGTLALAPALYGLWRSQAASRWLLGGLALGGLLAGVNAPGVADLLARLPPFNLAINERLIQVASLALALLAGLGLEAWQQEEHPVRFRWLQGATLLGLTAGALVLVPWLLHHGAPPRRFVPSLALALAPPAIVVIILRAGARGRQLAALLALLIAQRTLELRPILPSAPAALLYPSLDLLAALPAGDEPYRLTATGFDWIPNTSAAYGVEDVRGYQALRLARLVETFPLWSVADTYWFNRVDDLGTPFLRFLNVRWAITSADRPRSRRWRVAARHGGAMLLEMRDPLPRAFVPPRVRVGGSASSVLAEMAAERDFGERAWISRRTLDGDGADGRSEEGTLPAGRPNGPGAVEVRRDGFGYLLRSRLARPSWVVVSVTAWKGWRALRGREELPLRFANHAFLAVRAPAGEATIRLVYRPRSFELGRAISAATALGLLVAGAWWSRCLRRRPQRGPGRP